MSILSSNPRSTQFLNSAINWANSFHSSSSSSSPEVISPFIEIKNECSLEQFHSTKIRPLLDAVDQLRGIFSSSNTTISPFLIQSEFDHSSNSPLKIMETIRVPNIVVIGDQSASKSSVLESLSGISLPRGQNITTRCPLVMRLTHIETVNLEDKNKDNKPEEQKLEEEEEEELKQEKNNIKQSNFCFSSYNYAIIGLEPNVGERIRLEQIKDKIEEYTQKIAGKNTGVSQQPIYLTVYRPDGPDLTLVDLPGITRTPIGDQPKDIYKQIKNMIYSFIRCEESIILNIMPATVDLSTCECMMMSKEVDPEGNRTIGVVSKVDLAERGLRNKLEQAISQLNLKLGIVAVRNRTQEENENHISHEQTRQLEQKFFKNNSELSDLWIDNNVNNNNEVLPKQSILLGTEQLARLLTEIQEIHVRNFLPKIMWQVKSILEHQQLELNRLPIVPITISEMRVRIEQQLSSYIQKIAGICNGDHRTITPLIRTPTTIKPTTTITPLTSSSKHLKNELHLSPRLMDLFDTFRGEFQNLGLNRCSPFDPTFTNFVETQIEESHGMCLPNYVPHTVLHSIVQKQLGELRPSASHLVLQSKNLISKILLYVLRESFGSNSPGIIPRLTCFIQQFLDQKQQIILDRVEEFFLAEEELFTTDGYYMDVVKKMKGILYNLISSSCSYSSSESEIQKTNLSNPTNNIITASGVSSFNEIDTPLNSNKAFTTHRHLRTASHVLSFGNGLSKIFPLSQSHSKPTPKINNTNNNIDNNEQSFISSFIVNDIQLNITQEQINWFRSYHQTNSSLSSSTLDRNSTVLEMQINCFAYMQVCQKRLCDNIALCIRVQLVKCLADFTKGLFTHLQREINKLSDPILKDIMREESTVSKIRTQLTTSIAQLEKANNIFINL